jgi:CRISPR-associated exonuclease Cas4
MDTVADLNITGTLVWYYYICRREVWLMAHGLEPDQDNLSIDVGRLVHETSFRREKKEIQFDNVKMDIVTDGEDRTIVAEIKKSSRFKKSATMQLAFYLSKLKEAGVEASGELRFPTEKRREEVELSQDVMEELELAFEDIRSIAAMNIPPPPEKLKYCSSCGYREFCWV